MISLDNVQLTLSGGSGPVPVLRGVNLHVAQGEAVSVVGPSGSGKTTMLMLIAGLERAGSGTVRVNGSDMSALGEDQLARFRRGNIGIVFQAFHLVSTMTALENVALPMEFAHMDNAFSRAKEVLGQVGLAGRENHYPSQLSGGEQQRVAIARAFAPKPSILLADEPTGNLDQETGAKVMDALFQLKSEYNVTMLLITHDPAMAERCDRAVHMRNGCINNGAAPTVVP
ncbi:MAG: ABC transporter ATP-binding protein [Desulfovibrio sp.]|nr:MAG: ABC transporter ATP-binding protein [Desulfovibrio sp.]